MNRPKLKQWVAGGVGFLVSLGVMGALAWTWLPAWVQLDSHRATLEKALSQLVAGPAGSGEQEGKWSLGELRLQTWGGVEVSAGPVRWTNSAGETLLHAEKLQLKLAPAVTWDLAWALMAFRWTGEWGPQSQEPVSVNLVSEAIEWRSSRGLHAKGALDVQLALAWEGLSATTGIQSLRGSVQWNGTSMRLWDQDESTLSFEKPSGVPLEVRGKFDWSPLAFKWSEGVIALDGSAMQLSGSNTQWLEQEAEDLPASVGPIVQDWTLKGSGISISPWLKLNPAWKSVSWEGLAEVEYHWSGPAHRGEKKGKVHLDLKQARLLGDQNWSAAADLSFEQDRLERVSWKSSSELGAELSFEAAVQPRKTEGSLRRFDASVSGKGLNAAEIGAALTWVNCASVSECLNSDWTTRWSGALTWDLKDTQWKQKALSVFSGQISFAPGQVTVPFWKGTWSDRGGFDGVFGFQKKDEDWVYRYSLDATDFPLALVDSNALPEATGSLKLEGTGQGWQWPQVLKDWNAKGKLTLKGTQGIRTLGMDQMESRFTVTRGQLFATEFKLEGKASEDLQLKVSAAGTVALEKPHSLQLNGEFLEMNRGRKPQRTWIKVGCDWKAPCIEARADSKYETNPTRKKSRDKSIKSSG